MCVCVCVRHLQDLGDSIILTQNKSSFKLIFFRCEKAKPGGGGGGGGGWESFVGCIELRRLRAERMLT